MEGVSELLRPEQGPIPGGKWQTSVAGSRQQRARNGTVLTTTGGSGSVASPPCLLSPYPAGPTARFPVR